MTPAQREEELVRRETNATILAAKLEKDRLALEAEIAASAAASKAAAAINRALQSDARMKLKELEVEVAMWEAKLGRVKSDAAKAPALLPTPVAAPLVPARAEQEILDEKKALAAERAKLEEERAALDTEVADARHRLKTEAQTLAEMRTKLGVIRVEIESNVKIREAEVKKREAQLEADRERLQLAADSLMRAESQLAEERGRLEEQINLLASKEVAYEERNRLLQERLKTYAKA